MAQIVKAVEGMRPNGTENARRVVITNAGSVQFAALDVGTSHILWTSEDANFRVTFDGSEPSVTNGHVITANSTGTWTREMAEAAKFLSTTGTNAIFYASQMAV